MDKIYDVVAIGRAYTDIVSHVSSDFLLSFGIPFEGCRRCSASEIQLIKSNLNEWKNVAGGPSANAVATVASLGGSAGYFGKVSADEAGVAFLEDFEKRGISLCCPPFNKETEPSAICLALVTGENRSFAVDPGCSDCFSDDDFNKFDFSSTHSLLIEGFQLTSPLAGRAISKTIEKAKEDAKIAINLQGMRNWCEVPDLVNKVSSLADIIIGNSQEQTVFQGAAKMFEPCCKEDQLLITTKGSEGAELFQADTLTRYTVIARAPKVFVNPMGAGDAFAAGFLLAQSRKLTLQKSMCLAAKTATAVLEEESARPTRSLSYLFLGHGLLEQNK